MRVNAAWARLCVFGASVFATSLAIGLSLAAPSGAADNYPNRKVRVIVPFAAGGPTIAFTALPPAICNITDGSLRGIAILAKARVAALPELPTNVEEGVPGLESDTLTGIVAPAGTPKAIVDKWNAEIVKMAADPATKKKLDTLGFVPVANSPSEFAERIKSEMARWDKVVKTAGIQVD